jgi:putative ABC transport system permease protein
MAGSTEHRSAPHAEDAVDGRDALARPRPIVGLARTLWSRFSVRHAFAAPGQTLLLVGILSLGIAVYVSIRLANRAAVAGFGQFAEAVTGQSDFVLVPQAGVFDEQWLREIRRALGPEPVDIVPMLEASAPRPRRADSDAVVGREAFQLLGIDLVSAANVLQSRALEGAYFATPEDDPVGGASETTPTLADALRDPLRVWISPALGQRDGLAAGDTLELVVHESIVRLPIAGTIPTAEGLPAPGLHLLVMDLPGLQTLLRRPGALDRVELLVPTGDDLAERREVVRSTLESIAAERWTVETPASRRATGETMTAAFRLNLAVLSLIALLVGVLLIVQALDGAVVRRRQEIAVLRSLGVESRTIQRAWLREAATIGLVAGVLGTLLGWGGAQFTVRLVARTVNALYYGNTVAAASLHPGEMLAGVALGVVASVLAGWIPARAAASIPPAQLLARGHVASGLAVLQRRWPAVVLLLAALALSRLPALDLGRGVRFPLAGYLAALCAILGAGMFAGALFRPFARSAEALGRRFAPARVAIGHLSHPAGRARLAVAGLVAAVGMSAGMIVLVGSFERTVRGWIDGNLRADLFVASDGAQNASSTSRIQPETWRALALDPDVAGLELFAGAPIRIDDMPTFLGGFGAVGERPPYEPMWIAGPRTPMTRAAETEGIAYASESFVERFRVALGEEVRVPTPLGPRVLRIDGVFADYGNDRGSILVPMERFAAWFGTEALINFSAHLRPDADPDTVRARWTENHPGLRVLTNGVLRTEVLRIFRQTFSITYALELIGVFVAVAGLALSMASMLLDRRDELATLRALGFTHREIAAAAAWEGAAIATAGAAAGLALSLGLGHLLIHVINKQSFGWTLQFVVSPFPLLALALAVIAAGAGVSWFVGRWSANLPADKEE